MAIKFICSCGKHLRARDEMAARRSRCPRCGAPVGIPSLRPTHAGTVAAPMTPQERIHRRFQQGKNSVATDDPATAITATLPPSPATPEAKGEERKLKRRVRRIRQMEKHWYQSLGYPFLNSKFWNLFTLFLTILSLSFVPLSQELLRRTKQTSDDWLIYSLGLLIPLLLFAYVCATFECALSSALAGKGPGMYCPERLFTSTLKSGLRWLMSLLAGPIILLAAAGYLWLYGGDLTLLDWLILGELGVVAVIYWFLLIVSMTERNAIWLPHPAGVTLLLARLRYRAVVPLFVVPCLVIAHVSLGIFAAMQLHDSFLLGGLLLAAAWWSALFWALFVFRLVGVWCYRTPAVGAGP